MQSSKLWNKDFLLYYIATGFSTLGSYLTATALAYLILDRTQSTQNFAFTLAITAAAALFSPYAGSMVDRLKLKQFLAWGDFLRCFSLLLLIGFDFLGFFNIVFVYILVGFNAIISLFYRPAIGKLLPRLTGKDNLMQAYGLMGVLYNSASILGFLIGGFAVSFFGVQLTIVLDAISFFVMGIIFLLINTEQSAGNHNNQSDHDEGITPNVTIKATVQLMISSGIIVCPLLIFLNQAFLAPYKIELPLLFDSTVFGTFFACYSVGTLCSSILVSRFGERLYNYTTLFVSMLVSPLIIFVSSNFQLPIFYFVTAAVIGFFSLTASTISFSVIQRLIPDQMMGKVYGIMGLIEDGGLPILFLILGTVTGTVSMSTILLGSSIVFLIITGVFIVVIRASHFFKVSEPSLELR